MNMERTLTVDNDAFDRFVSTQLGIVVISIFCSSLAGLANVLRGGGTLSLRYVIGTVLHSGLWGGAVAMVLADYLVGHPWLIIAVGIMSGIGGATVIDFAISVLRHGLGIRIVLDSKEPLIELPPEVKRD